MITIIVLRCSSTNDEAWLAMKFAKDRWKEPGTTFQVQFQYFSSVFYSTAVAKQSNIIVQQIITARLKVSFISALQHILQGNAGSMFDENQNFKQASS